MIDRIIDYVNEFNDNDEVLKVNLIDNKEAASFIIDNAPYFECPEKDIEKIYYYRWWTYRKHIKKSLKGYVITEFLKDVPWAAKYNAIICPLMHQINEGRWLRDNNFVSSYLEFWFDEGKDSNKRYSNNLSYALLENTKVNGHITYAIDKLDEMVENYYEWENDNLNELGLFFSYDDRDGMEYSISGSGLRPTLNSYMYANAVSIYTVADICGHNDIYEEFVKKAMVLRAKINTLLWDEKDNFYKVIPLNNKDDVNIEIDFSRLGNDKNVKELLGYTPWCFNIPIKDRECAWIDLFDDKGFNALYGPTTAHQSHNRFTISYEGHECLWNGPSWPFATSVTLIAMQNLIRNYNQKTVTKNDYYNLIRKYTNSHYITDDNGNKKLWIDENLNPYTGEWIARKRLSNWENGGWSEKKGGYERGKDYNHSSYCDLIISGLIGIVPVLGNNIIIDPLIPKEKWDYFMLSNLKYHDKEIAIIYDKDGNHYGDRAGFSIYIENELVHNSNDICKVIREVNI